MLNNSIYGELIERGIYIIWFDSMGAKSSSVAIDTGDGLLLIDPGAAAMQPSYPLDPDTKRLLRQKAVDKIMEYASKSKIIIITHYHYDHHILPNDPGLKGNNIYAGKALYMKNPNKYINNSQWDRARLFLTILLEQYGLKLDEFLVKPRQKKFPDPVKDLVYIHKRNYGDYANRRRELLLKGKKWFNRLVSKWRNDMWIKENIVLPDNTRIYWGDGRKLKIGRLSIQILKPWFHGIEYDKTGWITPVFIESKDYKLFYTSDVMGPIIEDYAVFIADKNPDIVILDGPPTYLFPYMFNRINLNRAINNAKVIIDSKPELIIYDHHLLRDPRWRKLVSEVFRYAEKYKIKIITAAEVYGEKPLIDKIVGKEMNSYE